MRRRIDEINSLIDMLDRIVERYGKRKSKIIERDLYKLEVVVEKADGELEVRMYMTPKVNIDPKYLFAIYFTEFFPEIPTFLISPDKSSVFASRIILFFKVPPDFFDADVSRRLMKIDKFWRRITDPNVRAELDKILSELFELIKKTDLDSQRRTALLKMKINDILLYE